MKENSFSGGGYECDKRLKQFHKAKIESDRHLEGDRVKDKLAKKLLELVPEQYLHGNYLVAGKKISCFTNEEEAAVGLTDVVAFLLESKLIEHGATIEKAANFQKKVVVSDRLVTGQNPASALGVGEGMVKLIKKLSSNYLKGDRSSLKLDRRKIKT
jgi:hypothetical protein